MIKRSVLVVDDEESIRVGITFDLRKQGYDAVSAESGEDAYEKLEKKHFDVVISDLVMGAIGGIAVLKRAKELHPETQVIMLTGFGSFDTFSEATKNGAFDYLLKPCKREEIALKIRKCMEIIDLKEKLDQSERAVALERKFVELFLLVTKETNSSNLLENTMRTCLKEVCLFMKWTVGHFYVVSSKNSSAILEPSKIWYLADEKKSKTFVEVTEKTIFCSGEGLPGEVLATGKPKWITDIHEAANFPRAKMASELNIISGFAFPVMIKTEVVGVMEFFSPETSDPDERVLEVMAHIGIQMGRIIERSR